jgi:hypothetical protein
MADTIMWTVHPTLWVFLILAFRFTRELLGLISMRFRTSKRWGVKHFDFISPHAFLCSLCHAPSATEGGIRISEEDCQTYSKLQSKATTIVAALKEFTK